MLFMKNVSAFLPQRISDQRRMIAVSFDSGIPRSGTHLQQFVTVFNTKERIHMFKKQKQSTDTALGIAVLAFMLILVLVSTIADSRN